MFKSQPVSIRRAAPQDLVLRGLSAYGPLGVDVRNLVLGLGSVTQVRAGAVLLGERDAPGRARFIAQGWAARVRWLADGRRQILDFLTPGDAIGLCVRPGPLALTTILALTPVETLDAMPVQAAVTGDDPRWDGLRKVVAHRAGLEEGRLLNQILRLGRQSAYERLCHMILELRDRLAAIGVGGDRFPMPLTQETLADALGLSVVHVNRVMQQLRRDRLIEVRGGMVQLLDEAALQSIAEYRRPEVSTRP